MGVTKLLKTDSQNRVATLLRLVLAGVMFPHGAQKVLGWFDGNGFTGTMEFFTQQMGIPEFFAVLAILAEFVGPILLLFGFLTRVAAFGIFVEMAVAMILVHLPHGFFMNWQGNQAGEGFEFHILLLGVALAVLVRGAGALSIDARLSRPDNEYVSWRSAA